MVNYTDFGIKKIRVRHHLLIDLEVGATLMVYLDEVKVLIALLYSWVFVLLTLRPLLLCVRRQRLS